MTTAGRALALLGMLTLSTITACGNSDNGGGGGASDVSWKDVVDKKIDATKACQDLFGAHDADGAKKVGASALASAPSDVAITGEVNGDSGGKSGNSSLDLQCNIGPLATRFYPASEADDMTADTSASADANGFGAESHGSQKGPGMQSVLADAVKHLKP